MVKITRKAVVAGALLGIGLTILAGLLNPFLFIAFGPAVAVMTVTFAFLAFTVSRMIFGNKRERFWAVIRLLIVILLAVAGYFYYNYSNEHSQKYCDGVEVERFEATYHEPLPSYCLNQ